MEPSNSGGLEVPRFARGFVLSEDEVAAPVPGWSSEIVLGLHLVRAREVSVTQAEHGGSSVVVLGHLVDTDRWLPQGATVTAAAEALARSEPEFLDLTDAWSGRYLVLYGDAASRRVMTDAAGMRSAYHALEGPFVLATHARLVADIVGAPVSPMADAYRAEKAARQHLLVMPMPGRSTPWTGVVALTPNVALEVEGRRLRRIFPRGPLPSMDARSAVSAIGPRLRGQVGALVASGRPIAMSITAGRDSRVSLAASRPWHEAIEYFTYAKSGFRDNDWDVATASSMAAELGLSHRVLEVSDADASPELTRAMQEATIITHGVATAGAYRRSFPADTIHIRSNISEIARSYYRRKAWWRAVDPSPRTLTPDTIARMWGGMKNPVSPLMLEAFEEWMQAIGFADIEGLDGLDVLYWEHRMASWHANVVLESDFAFDTHVPFNARTILIDMLAVPVEDRDNSTVSELLVEDLWPGLGRWPHKASVTKEPAVRTRAGGIRRRIGRLIGR